MPNWPDPESARGRRGGEVGDGGDAAAVIDLGLDRPHDPVARAAAARAIGQACATRGFFVATGHGVPRSTITSVGDVASQFFRQPDEIKNALSAEPGDPLQRGFTRGAIEVFSLSRLGEPEHVIRPGDVNPVLLRPNRWPSSSPGFREACLAYYAAVETLAVEVTRLFALALELPQAWFDDKFDNHMTQLAVNHYQPTVAGVGDREFRNDPHQDWGTLTLLHQGDSYGGLQILGETGRWLDIPSDPGSFIVQIGDLMARWTNDRWVSAVHRVAQPPLEYAHRERISLAFFYQPNHDSVIECIPTCAAESDPPRHPAVTSYDYITAKVRRAYVVGRLARAGRTAQQVGGAPRLGPARRPAGG
jgi:isopenicillin N synthase-like dioxygenase